MSLSKKLLIWQNANLIDGETADKIKQFEQQNSKPVAVWAFAGLGAFSIILGLISVVASNWLQTPNWIKLTVALMLCFTIAVALFRVVKSNASNDKLWLRDILVVLYYGLTLASMALIGQVYQLAGSIAGLLLVWTLATLPIVLLGRGKFLSVLWIVSTSITYVLNIDAINDVIDVLIPQKYLSDAIVIVLYGLTPYLFILLSRTAWLLKNRPIMAKELSRYSWLAIVLGGWLSHFLWYESVFVSSNMQKTLFVVMAVLLMATATMVYFIPKLYEAEAKNTHRIFRTILITVFIIIASALWHQQSYPVVGAVTNLLYMFVLAWVALKMQSIKWFNFITALICLRLLFVYYEVFGSMLETGIGLVVGGIVTLLVVWGWFKKADAIAYYFGLSRPDSIKQDKS